LMVVDASLSSTSRSQYRRSPEIPSRPYSISA
jgi:hypothetical protein